MLLHEENDKRVGYARLRGLNVILEITLSEGVGRCYSHFPGEKLRFRSLVE